MKIKYLNNQNQEAFLELDNDYFLSDVNVQSFYIQDLKNIEDLEFFNCNFKSATFSNQILNRCIFNDTYIYGALFYQTTFKNCQFINAQFENCHFMECQFLDCDFTGISKNIDNYFINCNIYDFDNQAYFSLQGRNQVHSLHYIDKEYNDRVIHLDYLCIYKYKENHLKFLENHNFSNMYLHRLNISYLYLKNFDFSNSNLRGMGFDYSIVENCNFDNTFFCVVNCYNTIFKSCTFKEARFIGNRLFNCEFIDCDFTDATQPESKDSEFVNCNMDDFPVLIQNKV